MQTTQPTLTDQLLQREMWVGDRSASWVRLILCAVASARMVLIEPQALFELPFPSIQLGILVAGALLSAIAIGTWRPEPPRHLRWRLLASVALDTALLTGIILARVLLDDRDSYHGVVHMDTFLVFPVIIIGAAVRLEKMVATLGPLLVVSASLALIVIDYLTHDTGVIAYKLGSVTLPVLILVGTSIMGTLGVARRTQRLVRESARQTEYAAEQKILAERSRQRLGTFVSTQLVDLVMDTETLEVGGEFGNAVVLFTDLRGFTKYSEQLPPPQLVQELNTYLSDMVNVIQSEGGVIDKYIGDSIMAVFGVPSIKGDEAARAIRTCHKLEAALDDHNERRAQAGLPPFAHGIGVHFGPVVAGTIGADSRMQYTVIGDTVNLAARLEGACKDLGCTVVLSESLVHAIPEDAPDIPPVKSLGSIPIRGREAAVEVFTLA